LAVKELDKSLPVSDGVNDQLERQLEDKIKNDSVADKVEIERGEGEFVKLTIPNEISFDFDSAVIKPDFRPIIVKFADVILKNEIRRVTVVGHTDSFGAETYNKNLSVRRAEAVKEEFASHGVSSTGMLAIGKGASEPRADNDTDAGRASNRRVEIFLEPDPGLVEQSPVLQMPAHSAEDGADQ
jgi:outer membrane protein OmpA-like peptidoglycan-associated protein